jgi:hypothetical protein
VANILAKLAVLISGDASGLNKSITQSTKQLGAFEKASGAAGKALVGAFAAVSFAQLGREIINITAEFQKFEAVLTNTLGSNSEAQKVLERIKDFAAKTPFSVQELTASFVKLANQGFEPTGEEMRKLGDLAASTGKSFDQLTEAVIDAQAGEFERLKEFGIRAKKQGDQVTFTFKGVETQTKFTSAAINDYILSLGNLEGVSGSMAAISGTLGGSISNLGDSFDNLLLTVGNLTSGPLKSFIDLLQNSVKVLADDIAGKTGQITRQEAINELYVEGAKSVEDITANIEKLNRLKKTEDANLVSTTGKLGDYKNQLNLTAEEYTKLVKETGEATDFSQAYGSAIEALTKKLDELNKKTSTQALSLIPALNAEIKRFEELKNKSFSTDQIGRFNVKLQELRDELAVLNEIGSESGFLKNLNQGQTPTLDIQQEPLALANPFETMLAVDTQPILDKFNEISQASAEFNVSEETREKQRQATVDAEIDRLNREKIARQKAAEAAMAYGDAIGDALGNAISGEQSFADALKSITKKVLDMFFKQAMGAIIASATKSGGPPPVAIALAAAGMAAISAMFSRIGHSGGGASGGSSAASRATNVQRLPQVQGNQIDFNARFEIEGTKLVAVTNNTNNRSQRTG